LVGRRVVSVGGLGTDHLIARWRASKIFFDLFRVLVGVGVGVLGGGVCCGVGPVGSRYVSLIDGAFILLVLLCGGVLLGSIQIVEAAN